MKLKKVQVQYFKYTYSLNKQYNFFIRTFDSVEEAMNLINELELCIHYMFMSIKDID